jgi:hypothetical protein
MAEWFDQQWRIRNKITIDSSKVFGSLSNFPFLFNTTNLAFRSVSNGGAVQLENGDDIIFVDDDHETLLDFEIQGYDPVTGEIIAWVRIDSISSSGDKDIYIYYGNSDAVNQENPTDVWDSNYKLVAHLEEQGASTTREDSTTNNNDLTPQNFVGTEEDVGIIGRGQQINGTTKHFTTPYQPSGVTEFTIEGWTRRDASTSTQQFLCVFNSTSSGFAYSNNFLTGNDTAIFDINGTQLSHTADIFDWFGNSWHKVICTFQSGVTNGKRLYVDGILVASGTQSATITPGNNMFVAGRSSFNTFTGRIDEFRISDIARSEDYVKTVYNNESSPETFYTLGDQESTFFRIPELISLQFEPDRDVFITSTDSSQNFNAELLELWVLNLPFPGPRRVLLEFDISTVPSGISIFESNILLNVFDNFNPTRDGEVFRLTESWSETQATWNNRLSGTPWSNAGGTFDSSVSDEFILSDVNNDSLKIINITNNIRNIYDLNLSTANLILKIQDESDPSPTSYRVTFDDKESDIAPVLEILYSDISPVIKDLFVLGHDTINEDIDFSITGHIKISTFDTSLLYNENVLFYHPLDDLTEYILNEDWVASSGISFVDGLIESGIVGNHNSNISSPSNIYESWGDAENITVCFWSKMFSQLPGDPKGWEIGSSPFGPGFDYNLVSIRRINSSFPSDTILFTVAMESNFVGIDTFAVDIDTDDWVFCVFDVRKNLDSTWTPRISFSGQPWAEGSPFGSGFVFGDNDPESFIKNIQGASGIDEVCVWKNQDLFTDEQLLQLYSLPQSPLSHYVPIAEPLAADKLFIHGFDTENNNVDLFISSFEIVNEQINLFIVGNETSTDDIQLFIKGFNTETEDLDLFIKGKNSQQQDIDLFINGKQSEQENIDLFVAGKILFNNNIDLTITGSQITSNDINFIIIGKDQQTQTIDFIVIGNDTITETIDLFIIGKETENNNIDLIIIGKQSFDTDIDFTINGKNTANQNLDLNITGNELFTENIDLFIIGKDQFDQSIDLVITGNQSVNNNLNLNINGHNSQDQLINLFISSFEVINNNIDLFVSGFNIQTEAIDLFILGQDIQNEDIDLFINGHETDNNDVDFIINGLGLINNDLILFISSVNSSTNTIDLFISGPKQIFNNIDFIIVGKDTASEVINLFINGKQIFNNDIDFFIEGRDVTLIDQNIDLSILGSVQFDNQIDLFIVSKETINNNLDFTIFSKETITNNISLTIFGIDSKENDIDLFIFNQPFVNNNIDFIIVGSGIGTETDIISLIINGFEPLPAVVCPDLDPTATIQISQELIGIYQRGIDALISQLGKNIILEFAPNKTPCPNCDFDILRSRSNGVYKIGGPIPFSKGQICPYCKSRGLLETPNEICIKGLIKWNPKDLEDYNISVSKFKNIVRIKTKLDHINDIKKAKSIILDVDNMSITKLRAKLIRGPIPVGLRQDRYVIAFFEIIGE